jgi:DNA-binding XRE family transcriptional regulator
MNFNDSQQRADYFTAKLQAELTGLQALQGQRHHLFDAEREIIIALITARNRGHLTQTELAAKVGCGRLTIIRIETGKRSPSLRILLNIAKALDIGVALLPKLEL